MLHVSVISPEAILFDGEAAMVVAPAFDGEVGILTGHAPMMTLLGTGELRVAATVGGPGPAAEPRRFVVEGGFLQVAENRVQVVTERARASGG